MHSVGRPFARGPFPLYQDAAEEADVVLFAGAGGVDQAVEEVLHAPDFIGDGPVPALAAVNHWPLAISVNRRNFPKSEHYCADVFDTDPALPVAGKRVRLLWLSPDCRHFSPAKGSAPVSDSIRALAWIALPWVIKRRPRVIMLENVPAFVTWGPTVEVDGKVIPDAARKGRTFERFVRKLRKAGYVVEFREMNSANDGEATGRVRFFMIARCDGLPIEWGEDSHAPREVAKARGLRPHRPAADIIDWSLPCHSIFMTQYEARERGLRIKRPLEEATLARIAKGLFRYTIASADPFIVPITHKGDLRVHDVRDPLRTITGAHRGEFALCAPVLVGTAHGDHPRGAGLRAWPVSEGLRGVVGSNDKAVVAAYVEQANTRSVGGDMGRPMSAATSHAHHGVVAAFMEQANTGLVGHDMREGVSTILGKGSNQRLVTAALTEFRGSNEGSGDLRASLTSPTAQGGHHALLEGVLERDADLARPFAREGEVRAFLTKYYGTADALDLADPLHTATSKARFGLVLVSGVAYRIVDIGMRMLDPETELAAAMGVRKGFVLGFDAEGNRVSKTAITKMVGNMVCRRTARRLIRANLRPSPQPQTQRAAA